MVPGRPLSPKVETTFAPSTRIVATSSSASWICAITVCGRPGASRIDRAAAPHVVPTRRRRPRRLVHTVRPELAELGAGVRRVRGGRGPDVRGQPDSADIGSRVRVARDDHVVFDVGERGVGTCLPFFPGGPSFLRRVRDTQIDLRRAGADLPECGRIAGIVVGKDRRRPASRIDAALSGHDRSPFSPREEEKARLPVCDLLCQGGERPLGVCGALFVGDDDLLSLDDVAEAVADGVAPTAAAISSAVGMSLRPSLAFQTSSSCLRVPAVCSGPGGLIRCRHGIRLGRHVCGCGWRGSRTRFAIDLKAPAAAQVVGPLLEGPEGQLSGP